MLKVIELFGGIGAPCKALNKAGIPHEIIDYVENCPKAVNSYNAINGTDFKPQDITNWNKDIRCDYVHASTPCQAFSTAGKNLGANDHRGIALWEATLNVIKITKPWFITLENVKGLLQAKHKPVLDYFINELIELGFNVDFKVLNAKNYGIPQNRERVFIVASLLTDPKFPKPFNYIPQLREVLDPDAKWITLNPEDLVWDNVIDVNKFKMHDGTTRELFKIKEPSKSMNVNITNFYESNIMISPEGYSSALTATGNKYIYAINKLSQYHGKTIEIDLEKLNNQKSGEINRVAKLKNVEFNQAKHFIGGGGVSGTIRASQECLHDNKIMEDISFEQDKTFFGTGGVVNTLTTSGTDFKCKILGKLNKDYLFNNRSSFNGERGLSTAITAHDSDFTKIMNEQLKYRKLTPLECWRLMGFEDNDFNCAKLVNSDSQLCKQAGNSIVVNVMTELFKVNFNELITPKGGE